MRFAARGRLIGCWLAALLLMAPAAAQEAAETPAPDATPTSPTSTAPTDDAPPQSVPGPPVVMASPRITTMQVDWDAVRAALAASDQEAPAPGTVDTSAADPLIGLNEATGKVFANVAASGVPVLLPFDTGAFLRDRAQETAGDASRYTSGFRTPSLFYPGPSGYDAAFVLQPDDSHDLGLTFARHVNVQISASAVLYELDGPAVGQASPVPELEYEFPGIRRVTLEGRLRYIFTRFGVPYFVSVDCFGGGSVGYFSCRAADQVAIRFIKALNIVGGTPQEAAPALSTIAQPEEVSPDFTYYAPGDILPGTGVHGRSGKADSTVYSKIRFPVAHAPAYTNSQSFGNWGNCDLTGRIALGGRGRLAAYRCRVNDVPLLNDETKNYTYPWRDNFCEHRYWSVSQCPAGLGHQGEDIRPGACKLRNAGADRCEPYQDSVVAVRRGVVWRVAGDEALYLFANAPGEHIRFRYLHMNPRMLDFAGMVSGREVAEGDVLGPVGDYGKREGGTTYHLHFDMQVPTQQGWLFVNPYMTLVAAYERLIGGRGEAVTSPPPLSPASASVLSNPPPTDGMLAGTAGTGRIEAAGKTEIARDHSESKHRFLAVNCQTYVAKGRRVSFCRPSVPQIYVPEPRGRAAVAHIIRPVARGFSRHGVGAGYYVGNLHAGHGWRSARPGRT